MNKHTRHFLFLLAGLSFLGASEASPLTNDQLAQLGFDKKTKTSQVIPVDSEKLSLATIGGKDFLLTSNGKLAFEVSAIHNLWEGKQIEAKEINRIQFANLDSAGLDLEHVVLGSGGVVVNVLIDPLCGYCKILLQDARALVEKNPDLKFVFTIIPIGGPDSEEASVSLACLSSNETYWRLVTQDFEPVTPKDYEQKCVEKRIASAFVAQQAFTPKATPVLYMPNGEKVHGLPSNLSKIIKENLE